MENPNPSLFGTAVEETAAGLAAALALAAAPRHYDELRGVAGGADRDAQPTPAWSRFFENLGVAGFRDLNRRSLNLARQVRDNGITYNVYADANGPRRPWSLDLFPLIVTPGSWQQIEAGVLQRVRLLEQVMADVYGPQHLLRENLLPPALVQGHPGYLRALHGVAPAGGTHLHIAAFDLARDASGDWWVVSQRTQAPSGLGYLLENRLVISRLFPEAFSDLKVQRLAATYRALVQHLRASSPAQGEARIVLLTSGPYNETYFEHAYLARYLGLTLVEGGDLTVRAERLYLKTLQGLEPVHGVVKRLDDEFLDPLELRSDSRLGVPGLLQAIRAGHVLMANAPGSAFLESTALLGFLPAIARRLLGEELRLPALATWWCGEQAAMEAALPQLHDSVIKRTFASAGAVLGGSLTPKQLDEVARRLEREPDEHTIQAYLPVSQMPTWRRERLTPRSLLLRVFAVADGPGSWRVLPGGLTRLAGASAEITSMQRGGSSADTWVLTEGEVDATSLLQHGAPALPTGARNRSTTSRAAENLFWLGRYTERCENTTRLARLVLQSLNGEDRSARPLLMWLGEMAQGQGLVLAAVPPAIQARRVFERSLIGGLAAGGKTPGVGYNLAALRRSASAVRERLSQEHWNVIVRAEQEFARGCAICTEDGDYSPVEALRVLETLSGHTAAITGAQTDRMTRDEGWRLLTSGRLIERLAFLAGALELSFRTEAVQDEAGFEALVALFDSTITFHAHYQQRHDIPALLDLLVVDRENPRSLGWVAQTLRKRVGRLPGSAPNETAALVALVPNPAPWSLEALALPDPAGRHASLETLLGDCSQAAYRLSDELSALYFTHSGEARYVGS